MSSGVVYKQRYRSRNLQGTPGLNVRHLHYIATRPGAVHNPGCGFGLWGKLPGDDHVRIQTDLERAERILKDRSNERTVYRAVISVGRETAEQKGLYRRECWERIVNEHIGVLAEEMGIKPENFCWCASMHYAKNHPHVHIVYWDNGTDPRPESVPKHIFEKKAEHIRAEFSKALFHEEILEQQKSQREQLKEIRQMLQSMCREANPEKSMNVVRLYGDGTLDALSQQLEELLKYIPAKGSLRYAYVSPEYKALVDRVVESCLSLPELHKELEQYERCTRQIAALYSNGKAGSTQSWERAYAKLHRELANEVLRSVVEMQREIRLNEAPRPIAELMDKAASEILPYLDSFHQLQSLLPQQRIPVSCMENQIPGFRTHMTAVVQDVMSDARFRTAVESYALSAAGIDLASKAIAPQKSADRSAVLFGREISPHELAAYRESYRAAQLELRDRIRWELRECAGWNREAVITQSMDMLCSMIRLVGQIAGQQQSNMSRKQLFSKDKSKAAKRDQRASRSNSDWERDFMD